MTYNKFIRYGDTFELYEYEKEPVAPRGRNIKRRKSVHVDTHMDTDRKTSLSEEGRVGRRQDNGRRAGLAFRRIVASNLSRTDPPLLVTITYKENITDITLGYKDYRSFVQALRYKYGKTFKYICVPEFQIRGAVHFHALFWGLPSEVFLQERETRTIALIWGKGFVFLKETDGHAKISTYLSKYMSKAFVDHRLKNQKAYVASRNIKRPIVGRGFSPVWPVLDDYVGDNNIPIHDKTYRTRWLGTCRHRLFNIPSEPQE